MNSKRGGKLGKSIRSSEWPSVALAREENKPFWAQGLNDVNPRGNVYCALFEQTKGGWTGCMADFPAIAARGKTFQLTLKKLAVKLKGHCKSSDVRCSVNQANHGIIVGLRADGYPAIWIGKLPKLSQAMRQKRKPAREIVSKVVDERK